MFGIGHERGAFSFTVYDLGWTFDILYEQLCIPFPVGFSLYALHWEVSGIQKRTCRYYGRAHSFIVGFSHRLFFSSLHTPRLPGVDLSSSMLQHVFTSARPLKIQVPASCTES